MNDPVIARRIRERLNRRELSDDMKQRVLAIIDEDESNIQLPIYHVRINSYLTNAINRA